MAGHLPLFDINVGNLIPMPELELDDDDLLDLSPLPRTRATSDETVEFGGIKRPVEFEIRTAVDFPAIPVIDLDVEADPDSGTDCTVSNIPILFDSTSQQDQ
jgi:hypothetical protein